MSLPVSLPVKPCVGSGFCCKLAPCPYGEKDPKTGWCTHLVPWEGDDLGVQRYRCGRYEYIKVQPFADMVPAFGGGCCSPLFNEERDRIVIALKKKAAAP
jgi:hypothetical protein